MQLGRSPRKIGPCTGLLLLGWLGVLPLQAHQVDDGYHQACLEARDYSGCIELNQAAAQQQNARASEQKQHCTALNRTLLKEVRNAISVTALSYEADSKRPARSAIWPAPSAFSKAIPMRCISRQRPKIPITSM